MARTYNQVNYRNIWLARVTIILIMIAQVLFVDIFLEKYPHLNAVEFINIVGRNSRECWHLAFYRIYVNIGTFGSRQWIRMTNT